MQGGLPVVVPEKLPPNRFDGHIGAQPAIERVTDADTNTELRIQVAGRKRAVGIGAGGDIEGPVIEGIRRIRNGVTDIAAQIPARADFHRNKLWCFLDKDRQIEIGSLCGRKLRQAQNGRRQ